MPPVRLGVVARSARGGKHVQIQCLQQKRPGGRGQVGLVHEEDGRDLGMRERLKGYGREAFGMESNVEKEARSFQNVENVAVLTRMEVEDVLVGRERGTLQRSG